VGWLLLAATFALSMLWLQRACRHQPIIKTSEHLVETKVYRRPIIRLPFLAHDPPIPFEYLPIPPEMVKTSIIISTPDGPKIGLVIDKKGDVWKTTNTPDNVRIVSTKWKKPLIAVGMKFGLTVAYSGVVFIGLSTDYLRIGEFYIGSDIAVDRTGKPLVGLGVRFRIAKLGYDFLNQRAYMGISIQW